jgi:hypothetical protein
VEKQQVAYNAATEEYDGYFMDNRWKFMATARSQLAGTGIQTAGLSFWWFYNSK